MAISIKFYSSEVYHFDNRKAIVAIWRQIIASIKIKTARANEEEIYRRQIFREGDFLFEIVVLFLQPKNNKP